ncbi:EAL domain-containing protein [Pontibacter sp. JAM-7]|uniref:bifunctional diguanylate cyclase/phosphodiesterase n=1 Tax=Pontibacter sp. JAM-7 TaxID=3366581 RepID=UPI003AF6F8B7
MRTELALNSLRRMFAVALVLLIAALGYELYNSWHEAQHTKLDQLRQQTNRLIDHNRAYFTAETLKVQRKFSASLLSDPTAQAALIGIAEQPAVAGLLLLNADGQQVYQQGLEPDTPLQAHANETIRLVNSTNTTQVAPAITVANAENQSLTLLPLFIPLLDNAEKLKGILVELLHINGNDSFLNGLPMHLGTELWLIDNNGQVVLDYPVGLLSGETISPNLLAQIKDNHLSFKAHDATTLRLAGAEQLVSINYFSEYQLYTLSSTPSAVLQQSWINRMKPMIFAFVALLVILFVAYLLLTRKQQTLATPSAAGRSKDSLSEAIEQTAHGVVITDSKWIIRYANRHFTLDGQMHDSKALRKKPLTDFPPFNSLAAERISIISALERDGHWSGERFTDHNGHWYHISLSSIAGKKEAEEGYMFLLQDVTSRKKTELKLKSLARNEPLSGLPNRSWGEEQLTRALNIAKDAKKPVYICYLDIDSWCTFNDDPSHHLGDDLFKEIARRLRHNAESNNVFHMGGYGFLIYRSAEDLPLETFAEQLLEQVTTPLNLDNKLISISASAGVAMAPEDGKTVTELMHAASVALAEAKRTGRNHYVRYTEDLEAQRERKAKLAAELPGALENQEFYLVYQTKNFIKSGKMMGFEALLRWHSPKLGEISAREFIPIAEETGHVQQLGQFAIEQACTALANFLELSNRPMRMAVNLSLAQLRHEGLLDHIQATLQTTKLNPKYLELELGEPVLSAHLQELMPKLHEIRQLGIALSLDNFGTGNSSLSYLSKMPISSLKIDLTYIRDIVKNPHHAALTRSIISMAHALKLKVVAEGIESREQLMLLREFECDIVQGYLFTKPLSQEDMGDLIEIEKLPQAIKFDSNTDNMF